LWRLVTDAQPKRRFVGQLPVALNRDELVGDNVLRSFDVRVQLIERLAADAASAAVLEEQNRAFAGLRDRGVKLLDMRQWVQGRHK
jgi:hypothetical protein